jgi:hypothetical protein
VLRLNSAAKTLNDFHTKKKVLLGLTETNL